MIGRFAMPSNALETADAVALKAVFEVSGMTRISPPGCISSDFRIVDGSRDRISCRIPLSLTPDPRVATTGSGHSLISSGSSLSLLFVFVLGIPQEMVLKGPRVNGAWDDLPRSLLISVSMPSSFPVMGPKPVWNLGDAQVPADGRDRRHWPGELFTKLHIDTLETFHQGQQALFLDRDFSAVRSQRC
ncbi:hypothetical protein DEU52_1631 [Ensifer adhaerens]|nr:hypothetical protein DEU52_1631 [Ensifer adhaerens]